MVQRKEANQMNLNTSIFVVASVALISLAILFKYPKQFVCIEEAINVCTIAT